MEVLLPILLAVVLIVLAWKFLVGMVRTVALVVILLLAATFVLAGGWA